MVLMAAAVGVAVAMITGTMVVTSVVAAVVMVVVIVAAVMIEEVAVALVDVIVSSWMILFFQRARFLCFLKKGYGQTYGRTDPLIEMRGRI